MGVLSARLPGMRWSVTLRGTRTGESIGKDGREAPVAGLRSRLPGAGAKARAPWST